MRWAMCWSGDDATIRALLEEEVVPAEPSESECLRYYQANENRFRTPELFEAAHILIEPEGDPEQAWETTLARARRIVEQVGDSADDGQGHPKGLREVGGPYGRGRLGRPSTGGDDPRVDAHYGEALTYQ